jgi:hypothetical protein
VLGIAPDGIAPDLDVYQEECGGSDGGQGVDEYDRGAGPVTRDISSNSHYRSTQDEVEEEPALWACYNIDIAWYVSLI